VPNGTLGDDPILDITVHRVRVFSEAVDGLVRQLLLLMNSREVEELRLELPATSRSNPQELARLEARLLQWKESLLMRAKDAGWDLELLESRLANEE
jgi:hypothetical protein